jgi:hypothetical protein
VTQEYFTNTVDHHLIRTRYVLGTQYSLCLTECHFLNSKSQTKLNLTTYICKIINTYEIKYTYSENRVYDESNDIDVIL